MSSASRAFDHLHFWESIRVLLCCTVSDNVHGEEIDDRDVLRLKCHSVRVSVQ